jgi:hypothetical protein
MTEYCYNFSSEKQIPIFHSGKNPYKGGWAKGPCYSRDLSSEDSYYKRKRLLITAIIADNPLLHKCLVILLYRDSYLEVY